MNKETISMSIVAIIIFLGIGAAIYKAEIDEKRLETGCPCGGQYELFDVEYDRGLERFYYRCNQCDELFTVTH